MATNQAVLADAFYLLKAEMGPFVQERVQRLDNPVYRQFIDEHPQFRGKPVSDWGVDGLIKLTRRMWNSLFGPALGIPKICIVDLLRYRNKWAHQDPLSDDDTGAALALVARLLTVVSPTGTAGHEIERIRSTLQQRKRVGGPKHPAAGRGSKYNPFWESRIEELLSALERAVGGQNVDLNVTAITRLSEKKSWSGSVRVRDCEILAGKGDMAAHAKALGRVLAESGALSEWPNRVFRLSVNRTGERLSVRLDTSRLAGRDPVA